MSIRAIIDCDPGHDDAVALLLAHVHLQVLGVTTVSGNASLDCTTRNALAVLELLGVDTPVYRGARRPLRGEPVHALHVHGASGLGVDLPPPHRIVAGDDAPGFILETTRSHPDIWIVGMGPLTNIALALQRDPGLAGRIAGISLMGGSTTVGNATAVAEFNVWADPEAAEVVFRCGATMKMCGLNLTHQLRTSDELIARLRGLHTLRGTFVADLLEFMHARMEDLTGVRESAWHDPCAVLALTHPQLLQFHERSVSVELQGTHTRGMTVVDQRLSRRAGPAPGAGKVDVGYQLDADRALAIILEAVAAN